jgi:pre-mRNA cleavage complex 2 protein Pcf11
VFAFYLLDAISKNVYELYARRFSSFVVPLYLESYSQVDEGTRGKMEEMLLTWRTGSLIGKELFGVPQQIAIERGVWGDGGTSNSVSLQFSVSLFSLSFLQSGFHSGTGQIMKSQVLSELQFTLGQKERAVQSNPYDATSQNHTAVLHQVRLISSNFANLLMSICLSFGSWCFSG